MNARMIKSFAKVVLTSASLLWLAGCATNVSTPRDSVSEAFETSGVVSLNSYTRTIFSSSNF